ncbi:MAG: NAD(P)H-hydrate dehydratase [bacterium]|nr:NAD(P)H-hydrate dehydratase [bacterium]
MKVVTGQQMQALDRYTIEEIGLPGVVLMENAGRQVVAKMLEHFPNLCQCKVNVICGKGNNGGDGLVIARYLSALGVRVQIFLLAQLESLSAEAGINAAIVRNLGLAVSEILSAQDLASQREAIARADILVDAIFGTGLTPPVRGLAAEVIELLNAAGKPIVCVDLPSGLSADSSQIQGPHIIGYLTVTFALPKLAHLLPPACQAAGKLEIVDIGIPQKAIDRENIQVELIEPGPIRQWWPPRPADSHKGTYGHLLVLAGSVGKTGAAYLTSQAAARCGAGLVTLGIPESLNAIMEVKLTEVMTLPLPETADKTISARAASVIEGFLPRALALAVGPGLGVHPECLELIRWIIRSAQIPMVLDADGINVLAGQAHILKEAKQPPILTPHPKELSRLLGIELKEVLEDRLSIARRAARELNAYIVLKGFRTLIADPEGNVLINPTGNPGMATGGTGDVLTGVIGGLLAQKFSKNQALAAGVYLHGLAGDLVREQKGECGLLAQDLIDCLPVAINRLRR